MPQDHVTVVRAENSPVGGVVLLQEAFGVTDYLRSVAANLATAGWTVTIPHLYHRSGSPTFAYEVNEGDGVDDRRAGAEQAAARAIGPHALQMTVEGIDQDIDECLAALQDEGIGEKNTAALGFCFGGSIALYLSTQRHLGACVVFYGAGIDEEHFGVPAFTGLAKARHSPLLAHYGDHDAWIRHDDVDILQSALALSPVPFELIHYPDTGHGFHCDRRTTYHAASAIAAWSRTLEWLDEYAGGSRS
ncbi:MAG TPA: dienelactone hydrolase family protein [Acidimicrobiales bacterium]|nr:dienelactone hydrolase family protein [Acidimicrobiales bacterium]